MREIFLFNFNDITVLFGAFLALALALLLIFREPGVRIKRRYWICVASFFLLHTLHALDTLVYWNPNIRALFIGHPNFFFSLWVTWFLQGPLLYWFTSAALYRNFNFQYKDLLHLVPVVIFPFYLYMIYGRFDTAYKLQYLNDWAVVANNVYMDALIWGQRLSTFIYGSVCVYQLYKYTEHIKGAQFSLDKVDLHWLKLLVFGFAAISTLGLIACIQSHLISSEWDNVLGDLENYLFLVYNGALVFYLLQSSNGFSEIKTEHTMGAAPDAPDPHVHIIEKLQHLMTTQRPYLESNITVERLAKKLEMSPKLLSAAINSQLKMNFFELISFYRLDDAKRYLTDPASRDMSINDVMTSCGFRSKSVFNLAFKKSIGVTPSHYRQQYLG
jgi:AraC-like DNA-binding protein